MVVERISRKLWQIWIAVLKRFYPWGIVLRSSLLVIGTPDVVGVIQPGSNSFGPPWTSAMGKSCIGPMATWTLCLRTFLGSDCWGQCWGVNTQEQPSVSKWQELVGKSPSFLAPPWPINSEVDSMQFVKRIPVGWSPQLSAVVRFLFMPPNWLASLSCLNFQVCHCAFWSPPDKYLCPNPGHQLMRKPKQDPINLCVFSCQS